MKSTITPEELGERLFGRAMRLPVALWVSARPGGATFFLKEAARGTEYDSSNVAQELARLVDLGMLMRHEPTPGDRRVYFTQLETPLWAVIDAARVALGATVG